MSNPSRLPALVGLLLFALYAALFAGGANADPSGRVGYLSDSHGQVSYSPSGEDQWLSVGRNRPLIRGDRLWTDRDARAEFQVGSSAVRIDANSSLEILDLNDRIVQLQLTQGALSLSVRRQYRDQQVEIDSPLLAFVIDGSGRYRIDVDPRHGDTTIVVWEGRGEVYGENAHFSLRAGDTVRFYDTDLHDYQLYGLPREDDFDRYSLDRDQRFQRSESLRYVDDDLAGYSDLDEYGSWRPVSGQGHV
ncbi:FecR family protein [Marinobacterium arenosum]|uniref:FecR family protein n=1 Tax=Marinobacterium arenosum TaxID=2862496 RepID=UPI001C973009|nr:FecR family protein [Marinobacterium arenosum]MBY4675007.1 FecR family protein [Marinobacterium arenosum]